MSRVSLLFPLALTTLAAGLVTGCGSAASTSTEAAAPPPAPIAVSAVAAVEEPIARFIRATGSLMAEEQADVSAEVGGRIIGTPVERGTRESWASGCSAPR
jgi:multidrug efflux pump subunit AcrA (membrane-fusion protein)